MKKYIVMFLIGIILIGIIFLGYLLPHIFTDTLTDLPKPVRSMVYVSMDNPIERLFIFGYEIIYNNSEEYPYRIKVKTWFGLTYADIYVDDNGDSAHVER